ncbi:MAG: VPLPA-CTERM sorting domain-containing protein [Methylococcaceae bacterium]|nr:VPLPA-CTERM sorting domain-containing protein [Methylococcaceae bacterium]
MSFGYLENTNTATNGAIGVDNIKIAANVSAVPVPGAVWLLGSGLAGLVGLQRRKKSM